MDKNSKIFGVDISKDYFDVVDQDNNHSQYGNDARGFSKFLEHLTSEDLVVMEATGYYHYRLAQFLSQHSIVCSVVNPLSVKRFIQMKLAKTKTDKSDAKAICEYAQVNTVPVYSHVDETQAECLQLFSLLDIYQKQLTAIKNKQQGEEALGRPSKAVYHSLNRVRKNLQKEINHLEEQLLKLVKLDQQEQLTLLKSIPGMGVKTALFLIVITGGFEKFETASQLCCYAGITPTHRTSGSSVRGKSRISKVGNKKLRYLLFLCAFSACKYNPVCKALYDRLVEKGKSKKLALLAVENKLLKQAFAIVKSKKPFDAEHRSVLKK
ncbi:IS110 family transposase [Flavobacterium sp. CS20]|uniref:IS110 family transposase n=1 Tax=Flavobacterium sp. CS20 TaxID=2775246 RepID=UPI001B3A5C6A|nr:IS110 family transposase [Flavobacterium sp. CS20]QTY27145.1 IS110 family transposase [Flavobacterium sp. CS20]